VSSLISQEDLPGIGTLPTIGRLSWLQRAGPSATLDKSYSVAGDATGGRRWLSIGRAAGVAPLEFPENLRWRRAALGQQDQEVVEQVGGLTGEGLA
jgi:hypothetical protein